MQGQARSMAGFPEMIFIVAEENNKEFWKSPGYFCPFFKTRSIVLQFSKFEIICLANSASPLFSISLL